MKLHTYFRSSAAFRVRIALNLKGLAYDTAFVHLAKGEHRAPAYSAVNPQGLLPTLDDGVEGMAFITAAVRSSAEDGRWVKFSEV